ncbi:hypothetical protein BofuT4_uP157550.1 [Botrytis cinerea T4]|uniref:Uncharacterized protein n=1 Tax=Botryotinia fuckeliana (strain T4) TaxID=999810 RepID=G2YUR1_BOTF4|nr:hypothetical protein BofuT4_uP157550.1 [Botrytis cinerea T4]
MNIRQNTTWITTDLTMAAQRHRIMQHYPIHPLPLHQKQPESLQLRDSVTNPTVYALFLEDKDI